MFNYDDNPEALKVIEVLRGGENVCLIGKAGTGKTTLVHHIRDLLLENNPVTVAPTGIAAINADGVTIHSLFRFSFNPQVPADTVGTARFWALDADKRAALAQLKLLIIDEISMVRADLLDAIDHLLRAAKRDPVTPYGGVQVLLVGDPYQLPPVVTTRRVEAFGKNEDQVIAQYYRSPFFFDSEVFGLDEPVVVELQKVYRQADEEFVGILNGIRNGKLDGQAMNTLNARVTATDPDNIYLTSTKNSAASINMARLDSIEEPVYTYYGKAVGAFPKPMKPDEGLPTEMKLGSRVMTTCNNMEAGYVNGSIGTVIEVLPAAIKVEFDNSYKIKAEPIWVSTHTIFNTDARGNVLGRYTFIPLRLAWAITIHKSQGLTFDKVNICPKKIFADGQLYVALSRCRSMEGLVLTDPILPKYVKVSKKIQAFMQKQKERNAVS